MKKITRSLVSMLLFVLGLAVEQVGTVSQNRPEKDLLDIESRMTSAYLNKDMAAFFQSVDEELSAFHASNPYRLDDRKTVEDGLKTFYKYSTATGLYKVQPRVQIVGDAAVVTYHFIETGEAEGGKLYAYEGKQTDVFVRKNGRWTLIHFHSSRVTKPS